jgi:hypothetical protein
VSLVDDDQMIKALSADRAIEPLGDRIRARGPKGVLMLVMPSLDGRAPKSRP